MARLTPETERFLRKAAAGLPYLKRSEAKGELRAHLHDAIVHRVARGCDRTQAEKQAVAALGDAAALNRGLLRAHFGRWWLPFFLRHKLTRWLVRAPSGPLGFLARVERTPRDLNEEAIARLERELAGGEPNFWKHEKLAALYDISANHELKRAVELTKAGDRDGFRARVQAADAKRERALALREAQVAWLEERPSIRRMVGGQRRALAVAYSSLAGTLESLGRDDEAETAVRAGLAVDDEFCGLNFQQAQYCLKRGDLDGAFLHLDAALDDDLTGGDHGKSLLFVLNTETFAPLRQDRRFGRILQRAYEWA